MRSVPSCASRKWCAASATPAAAAVAQMLGSQSTTAVHAGLRSALSMHMQTLTHLRKHGRQRDAQRRVPARLYFKWQIQR